MENFVWGVITLAIGLGLLSIVFGIFRSGRRGWPMWVLMSLLFLFGLGTTVGGASDMFSGPVLGLLDLSDPSRDFLGSIWTKLKGLLDRVGS